MTSYYLSVGEEALKGHDKAKSPDFEGRGSHEKNGKFAFN